MKKTITTLLLFFVFINFYAQDPNILWQRTIGGSGWEDLEAILKTDDGGTILAGSSNSDISGEKTENSNGFYDYWIVKLSVNGEIEWQNTIGGSGNDEINTIIQTPDGGYFAGGSSNSNISGDKSQNSRGGKDFWLVRLDSAGIVLWDKTYGGTEDDDLRAIVPTTNGGYLLAGSSRSNISGDRTVSNQATQKDIWMIKIDNSGEIGWQKALGIQDSHFVSNMEQTDDGGYILGGLITIYSPLFGTNEYYWAVKMDSSANTIWNKHYGGEGEDWMKKILPTADGGFIITGLSNSDVSSDKSENSQGDFDYWVVKTDSSGNIEWENTIGGSEAEQAEDIIPAIDGGYYATGWSYSNASGDKTEDLQGGQATDLWILKLNEVGVIEWQNSIGGYDGESDTKIFQENNGSIFICATSSSDISGDKTDNSRGAYDYWILKHNQTLGID